MMHQTAGSADAPHAKKAKAKCENCQEAECQCQSGCCGGACPHCTF